MPQQRIIKAGCTSLRAAPASELSLAEFRRQGEALLQKARAEAERILIEAAQRAEAEAQRLLAEARERGARDGFREGYDKGIAEGRAAGCGERAEQIDRALAMTREAMEQAVGLRHAMLRDARTDLITLALAVAERVVKAETNRRSREIARANLEAAIELAARKSTLWIHANPADAAFLMEHLPALRDAINAGGAAQVLKDDSISPGGAVVRTESGEVDAQIETQLEQLARELLPESGVAETGEVPGLDTDEPADTDGFSS